MLHDREQPDLTKSRQVQQAADQGKAESNGGTSQSEVLIAAAHVSEAQRQESHARAGATSNGQAESHAAGEDHAHPKPRQSAMATVLLSALLSVPCGAAGAWAYLTYLSPDKSEADPVAVFPTPTAAPAPQTPAVSVEEFSRSTKQLEALSDRIDHLQERFAAIPRPEPMLDLEALKGQVENLTKDDVSFAALPGRISALSDRVLTLEKAMASLRPPASPAEERKNDGSASAKKTGSSALASLTSPASRTTTASLVADPELAEGIELFKRGQYAQALAAFTALERTSPRDARVWYFAALSNGLKSGHWQDESERLCSKGLECERAGLPDTAKINAAFAELTASTGRDWLANRRKMVNEK